MFYSRSCFGLAFVFLLLACSSGNARAQKKDAPSIRCEPVIYRVLPGEFNFCVGRRLWEKGRYPQAIELFELSAAWGSKAAQRMLGIVYFNGEGVGVDRGLGLAWLSLAAERDDEFSRRLLESALRSSTQAEQKRMQGELAKLRPRYADQVAATRAAIRFKRELRQLQGNPVYGSGRCLSGINANLSEFNGFNPVEKPSGCSMSSEKAAIDALESRYMQYQHGSKEGKVIVGPLKRKP